MWRYSMGINKKSLNKPNKTYTKVIEKEEKMGLFGRGQGFLGLPRNKSKVIVGLSILTLFAAYFVYRNSHNLIYTLATVGIGASIIAIYYTAER